MTDLHRFLLTPTAETVKAICAEDYFAVEVVEDHFLHLESINPKVSSVVRVSGENALHEVYITQLDLGYR